MTKITLLPPEEARSVLNEAIGGNASDVSGIADLVRFEVSARSICQRWSTVRRVQRLVAPVASVDENAVAKVCDLLEREGDIMVASGGVLFGTPLRAVDLGNGVIRVACSLPTKQLSARMTGTWTVTGVSRVCRFDDEEQAKSAVVAASGLVLRPEDWACLDRVPCANQAWIDILDRRLRAEPEGAGSLERDEPLSWRGCVADESGFRWASPGTAKEARLWRARNTWGHWVFAWTQEGTPKESSFVSLRPDEGTRTAFAVARILSSPVEVSIENHGEVTELLVPAWLPHAEYRFLAVASASSRLGSGADRWALPNHRLDEVLDVLHERLGLVVRKETTP